MKKRSIKWDSLSWEPNPRIVKALKRNIDSMPEEERKKEVAVLGISDRKFNIEEMHEIYKSGEPREIAEFIEEFLVDNTVRRLIK